MISYPIRSDREMSDCDGCADETNKFRSEGPSGPKKIVRASASNDVSVFTLLFPISLCIRKPGATNADRLSSSFEAKTALERGTYRLQNRTDCTSLSLYGTVYDMPKY